MPQKRETKTVLIIEDDADIRRFVSRVLELEGYRVLLAGGAEEGLRLVREGRIALVLVDLGLPGCDGWAVLEQMKGEPELSAIPVVVFSASAVPPQREKAVNMDAVDYLVKPLSVASVREAVSHILRRKG